MAINAKQFRDEILEENTCLIDVRTPSEYNAGHIKGSVNIPVDKFPLSQEIKDLDRNRKIRLYCHSGGRSAMAKMILNSMKFTDVDDLKDGIIGWPYEIER